MATQADNHHRKGLAAERGIALMLVLWVMIILMGVVLSFAGQTRGETAAALAFRTGLENKFLAEAAMERGIMEIQYRRVNRGQTVILEGREVWRTDGTPYYERLGEGNYRVSILDESGKININALTDATGIVLKNLLAQSQVTPEQADIIVDSILDWKDEDNLHRLNGAEDEYYASLPNPYKPRNAPFEALEELLLVRGMSADILYGSEGRQGIYPFLTIASKIDKVNLGAAPRPVLLAIPGMAADAADRIVEYRKSAEIRGLNDIRDLVGGDYALMAPYVGTGESATYSLTAVGYHDKEQKGHMITATVTFETSPGYRILSYKSPSGVKP